jgi:hypothetical protein
MSSSWSLSALSSSDSALSICASRALSSGVRSAGGFGNDGGTKVADDDDDAAVGWLDCFPKVAAAFCLEVFCFASIADLNFET